MSLPFSGLRARLVLLVLVAVLRRVVEFNPAAEKTFGYSREQAVGRAVDELIVPSRLRAEAALGALAKGDAGALRRRVERVAMRADGTLPPAEEVFTADDCWALRRGRPHVVEGPVSTVLALGPGAGQRSC